jgi:hypothetical protein
MGNDCSNPQCFKEKNIKQQRQFWKNHIKTKIIKKKKKKEKRPM